MRNRTGLLTMAILLAALSVYLVPAVQPLFVFEREAILRGEWWRLLTCHLVHFSPSHLVWDLTVFGVTGWIAHERGYRGFGRLCGLASLSVALAVLLAQPHLDRFGGLSGVATATVVFVALRGLVETPPWRWVCRSVLAVLAVKTAVEWATQRNLFAAFPSEVFIPVPLSHLVGALVAFAVVGWTRRHRRASSKCVREKSCATPDTSVDGSPCH